MSYREVHVVEVKEVVRLWLQGASRRAIARLTSVERKPVRRYVDAARQAGCREDEPVGDDLIGEVIGPGAGAGSRCTRSLLGVCAAHREPAANGVP